MTLARQYRVNLGDYRTDGADRGWGPGWPNCTGSHGKIVTVIAPLSGARFPVHTRVARMWSWWVGRAEEDHHYRFKPAMCGGHNCRAIGGTRISSNHAWGLACDVNWADNPFDQPLRSDIPQGMIDDAAAIGWAWGGAYGNYGRTGRADAMHFEFMGTPEQADCITAGLFSVLRLGQRPVIQVGIKGSYVVEAQCALMIEPSGIFDADTEVAVRQFQRVHGLAVDGVVGSDTWDVLDRVAKGKKGRQLIDQDHFVNQTTSPVEYTMVLSIDSLADSIVMPAGSRAWVQISGACPRDTAAKTRVWWLVERDAQSNPKPRPPADLPHGHTMAFELSSKTVMVEIGLEQIPPGFAVVAHLDGIGHA